MIKPTLDLERTVGHAATVLVKGRDFPPIGRNDINELIDLQNEQSGPDEASVDGQRSDHAARSLAPF